LRRSPALPVAPGIDLIHQHHQCFELAGLRLRRLMV
jgi:hypothetical protein